MLLVKLLHRCDALRSLHHLAEERRGFRLCWRWRWRPMHCGRDLHSFSLWAVVVLSLGQRLSKITHMGWYCTGWSRFSVRSKTFPMRQVGGDLTPIPDHFRDWTPDAKREPHCITYLAVLQSRKVRRSRCLKSPMAKSLDALLY